MPLTQYWEDHTRGSENIRNLPLDPLSWAELIGEHVRLVRTTPNSPGVVSTSPCPFAM